MSGEDLFNVPLSSESDTGEVQPDIVACQNDIRNKLDASISQQDNSIDEEEEKHRLIMQVLDLQSTLDDLSQKVDSVKEENLKLRSENQVLGQYIENLMAASNVFQSSSPKAKKKSSSKKR